MDQRARLKPFSRPINACPGRESASGQSEVLANACACDRPGRLGGTVRLAGPGHSTSGAKQQALGGPTRRNAFVLAFNTGNTAWSSCGRCPAGTVSRCGSYLTVCLIQSGARLNRMELTGLEPPTFRADCWARHRHRAANRVGVGRPPARGDRSELRTEERTFSRRAVRVRRQWPVADRQRAP